MEYKIIIAGSRTFTSRLDLFSISAHTIKLLTKDDPSPDITIISGNAPGADQLAIEFANTSKFKLLIFPADWRTHGRAAGPIRNKQMALAATHLIAFWDGKSPGTKNMIDTARKHNLDITIASIS